jgi:hypothetical protein
MRGHWQKEVPAQSGSYWAATRQGEVTGPLVVSYLNDGKLVFAGGSPGDPSLRWSTDMTWKGWWWSEPIETPPTPPAW